MMTVRTRLIALAIAICIVPAFAQTPAKDPAKPADKPAEKKEAPKAEPAKPAPAPAPTAAKEPAKDAAKPTAAAPTATAAATGAKIGSPAPDFKLKDLDGKERSLAEFKGKIVVLEWANAGCPVCVRHAKAKTGEKTAAAFKDKGVVWINVDSTATASADDVKKFVKEHGITAPYLMDPAGTTGKAYGAKTTPHMFVIDAKGNLAYSGAIDDDNSGSKGDKAKNYVKDAIEALLKGSTVATATTEPYGCSVKYKG